MSLNSDIETIQIVRSSDLEESQANRDNVQVKSSMIHDSSNTVSLNIGSEKLDQLLARLSTTHAQLDFYSQRRTQQISIETQNIIQKILQETKDKQRELLVEAQLRAQQFQQEYQKDLQWKINQLNEDKAQQLADLEKNLNIQQENILINARQQIDLLQREANLRKIDIMNEAQRIENDRFEQITEQVVSIGQEDSANRLATETTTVITAQAVVQGHSNTIQDNQQTLRA